MTERPQTIHGDYISLSYFVFVCFIIRAEIADRDRRQPSQSKDGPVLYDAIKGINGRICLFCFVCFEPWNPPPPKKIRFQESWEKKNTFHFVVYIQGLETVDFYSLLASKRVLSPAGSYWGSQCNLMKRSRNKKTNNRFDRFWAIWI